MEWRLASPVYKTEMFNAMNVIIYKYTKSQVHWNFAVAQTNNILQIFHWYSANNSLEIITEIIYCPQLTFCIMCTMINFLSWLVEKLVWFFYSYSYYYYKNKDSKHFIAIILNIYILTGAYPWSSLLIGLQQLLYNLKLNCD